MNSTLKEIIYNLKNLRQAGRQSQDTLLQDSQYAFIVDQYRATLIERELAKDRALSPIYTQVLEVPFKRIKTVEDDIFGDRKAYKATIPSIVQTNTRPLTNAVRSSMFSSSMNRSTRQSIIHDLRGNNSEQFDWYFPLDKDLYVVTSRPLEKLFIEAVFEHPLDVELFRLDNNQDNQFNPYDPYDFEYPLSLKQLDSLYKLMTDGEIKLSLLTVNDTQADGLETRSQVPSTRSRSNEAED